MVALILEIGIALFVSNLLYQWIWWVGLIAFPFILSRGNTFYDPTVKYYGNYGRIVDWIIIFTQIAYLIISTISFQSAIGSWYGWIIGLVLGWILNGWITPKSWNYYKKGW